MLASLPRLLPDIEPEPTRKIPDCIDDDGRLSFVRIAQRAQIENVNWYTVLSLGLQTFVRTRAVEATAEAANAAEPEKEKEAGPSSIDN